MMKTSELRSVVLTGYGVALAIAREVHAVQNELIDTVRSSTVTLAEKVALDEFAKSRGGTSSDWKFASETGPGHWWAWYAKQSGASRSVYAVGLWVYAADIKGRVGMTVESRMNAKLPGITGTTVRHGITGLPAAEGDKWVSAGVLAQSVEMPSSDEVEDLSAATMEVVKTHLVFLRGLYDEVLVALG